MSENTILIWLAIAISLLVLIQVVVLVALLAALVKGVNKARQVERNLLAAGVDLYALAGTSYRLLGTLQTVLTQSVGAAHSLQQWSAAARTRLARLGHSISPALELMEQVRDILRRFSCS